MLSKTTEVLASALSLKITENDAYGIYNEYFVSLCEYKHNRIIDISCYLGDADENSLIYLNLSDAIKALIENYHIADYELTESSVSVSSGATNTVFQEMVDEIINLLKEACINGSTHCSVCGEEFPNPKRKKVATVDGTRKLVCESCAFELLELSQQENNDSEKAGTPIGKIIWTALVGGVVGAIVYILAFFLLPLTNFDSDMLKYFLCLLGAGIGATTAYGSKLIAKPVCDQKFAWVISVVSVVFTIIAHYFGNVLFSVRYYADFNTFKFTPWSFFKVVFDSTAISRFFISGGIIAVCAACFALVFIVPALMKSNGKAKKTVVSVTNLKQ